jgi:hypothetical protein
MEEGNRTTGEPELLYCAFTCFGADQIPPAVLLLDALGFKY